jgi:DNA gyrase/topoisomerase IV subunit A
VMLISAEGIVIRQPVAGIPRQGRLTQGVAVMGLKPGDQVVSLATLNGSENAPRPRSRSSRAKGNE